MKTMEIRIYSFSIFVTCLMAQAYATSSINDAQDIVIIERLLALEEIQRENQIEIQALKDAMADQQNTIVKQSTIINALEQDVEALKVSQHHCSKQLRKNERHIQSLLQNSHVKSKARRNTTHLTQESSVPRRHDNEENVTDAEDNIGTMEHDVGVSVPRRQAPEIVAFTVYLDHDEDYGTHQTIKFNRVITNEGSGYNVHTGVFTCVTDGLYLLHFALGERDVHQQYAALKINSKTIVNAVAETNQSTDDDQGGNLAVVRLHQGDSVWVETQLPTGHTEGSTSLRLTTFTGVLLLP